MVHVDAGNSWLQWLATEATHRFSHLFGREVRSFDDVPSERPAAAGAFKTNTEGKPTVKW